MRRTFLSPVQLDFAIDFLDMDISGIFLTLWYTFLRGILYTVFCNKSRDPRIQNPYATKTLFSWLVLSNRRIRKYKNWKDRARDAKM